MSWLFWRGVQDSVDEVEHRPPLIQRQRWTIDIDEFGYAEARVHLGDIDGSGETPGVQLEIEHDYTDGPKAIALSAREAELLGRALLQAGKGIRPHERLRARRRKWQHHAEEPKAQVTTLQPQRRRA